MIRLQSAKRRDIPNSQDSAIEAYERNWSEEIPRLHPEAVILSPLCADYNCHGLTFASRRAKITEAGVLGDVLGDDGFEEVANTDAAPGDVVVYSRPDGDTSHSGFVVEVRAPLRRVMVWSKWGNGPEMLHAVLDVPAVYGTYYRVFRKRCS